MFFFFSFESLFQLMLFCSDCVSDEHEDDKGKGKRTLQPIISPYVSFLAHGTWGGGGRLKNTHELLNISAQEISLMNNFHIFQWMGKIFCVEFQRYPLKFHTKYLIHTFYGMIFMKHWNIKSSYVFLKRLVQRQLQNEARRFKFWDLGETYMRGLTGICSSGSYGQKVMTQSSIACMRHQLQWINATTCAWCMTNRSSKWAKYV